MNCSKIKIIVLVFASLVGIWSCTKPSSGIPDWPWDDPVKPTPVDPEPGPGPEPEPEPEPVIEGKARYIWIDGSANFRFYADSKEQIATDLKRLKDVGFTDIILDVRPTEGVVLFNSNIVPRATELPAWVNGQYKMIKRKSDFDYLGAFIEECRKIGLGVYAAMNTFVGGSGGYYGLKSIGPIYSGDIPESWATVINSADGVVSSFDPDAGGAVFLNPSNDDVQNYVLDIIGELATYDLDGIILDRCRFDDNGLQCEFSDITRAKFEQYLGTAVKNWPSDILKAGATSLPSSLSSTQKSWMSFRVKVIHDFVQRAAQKVHSINDKMRFGCYVGAWFTDYYPSGVNWASPDYDVRKTYRWADTEYQKYGYADHCDFMFLGCYAGTTSVYGSTEWTMQGFAKRGMNIISGACECIGGPDIGNASGFEQGGCEKIIPQTVDAIINASDGYFCFDLCHIRMYDYWNAFKKGFDEYLSTLNNQQ